MWIGYQNDNNVPLLSSGISGQPVAFRKQHNPNDFPNGQLTVQQWSCYAEEVISYVSCVLNFGLQQNNNKKKKS